MKAAYAEAYRRMGLTRIQEFSIAIYYGEQPWSLGPIKSARNPVLSYRHVTDVPAAFVADPFLIRRGATWFMFFEVMRADTWRGEIAFAFSDDAVSWSYGGIVLAEPFHLSYPHVFEADGAVYMIPESFETGSIRLYRATGFPTRWTFERELVTGAAFTDASLFEHDGFWWLFTESSGRDGRPPQHDTLSLYHAPHVTGPWIEHPSSPVVEGHPALARPAGRVVTHDGQLLRFTQDCASTYGLTVNAVAIDELTVETYREQSLTPVAILGPGTKPWNRHGMHHIDAQPFNGGWIAAVDGWARRWRRIGTDVG